MHVPLLGHPEGPQRQQVQQLKVHQCEPECLPWWVQQCYNNFLLYLKALLSHFYHQQEVAHLKAFQLPN